MKESEISERWLLITLLLAVFVLLAAGQQVNAQQTQWLAEYYDNPTLSGAKPAITTSEAVIDHRWGIGSPSSSAPTDYFSARWTKTETFDEGYYRFVATMDDGMRVYLDDQMVIDYWHPSEEHTATRDVYVSSGQHEIRIEYFESQGMATAVFSYAAAVDGSFYPNWKGEYFNNKTLSGPPVLVRDDRYLDQNWGTDSPAPGIVNGDLWSARWTRTLNLPPGTYNLSMLSDDGARVYFDDQLVFDQWREATGQTAKFNHSHGGGQLKVRVEYFDELRNAAIRFGYNLVEPAAPNALGALAMPVEMACPDSQGMIAVVNANNLNVRSGPGVQFEVVETLEKCDQVFLMGYIDPSLTWVRLNNPNPATLQQLWVNSQYLDVAVPVSSFAVAE